MNLSSQQCGIILRELEVLIHLGWPESERARPQSVLIDLKIDFNKPPLACVTDSLDNTICYDAIVQSIKTKSMEKPYRLLEHLCADLFHDLTQAIPDTKLSLRIQKKPPIENLQGGVIFFLGDDCHSW